MNIGKGRWSSKYICDKCGKEIPFIGQKGYVGIMHYCSKGQRAWLCLSLQKRRGESNKKSTRMVDKMIFK